jgi:hypothetical protein
MNELLSNENESTSEPKLLGLPRSAAGALIGVLIFLIVSVLTTWGTESKLLSAILLSPGILTLMLINYIKLGSSVLGLGNIILMFAISSIPAAIIGSLIISKKKIFRISGFVLLGIYFILSIYAFGYIARSIMILL